MRSSDLGLALAIAHKTAQAENVTMYVYPDTEDAFMYVVTDETPPVQTENNRRFQYKASPGKTTVDILSGGSVIDTLQANDESQAGDEPQAGE